MLSDDRRSSSPAGDSSGKRLVITRVDYSGRADGAGKGRGRFIVELLGRRIVTLRESSSPIQGSWTGSIVARPVDEHRLIFRISNSSMRRVVLRGRIENDE